MLQNQWNYIHRVTSGNGNLYEPIEKAIKYNFLPELLHQPRIGTNICNQINLTVKRAGMGIPDPTSSASENHATSMDCCTFLMESLLPGAPLETQAHQQHAVNGKNYSNERQKAK